MKKKFSIAVVKWVDVDGIAKPIGDELTSMGHDVKYFIYHERIPENVDIVFSFAPYGRFNPIVHKLSKIPKEKKPIFLHWNFESFPNHKIPWDIIYNVSRVRSKIDRLYESENKFIHSLVRKKLFSIITTRMHKFRYVGDYLYAYNEGVLDFLFETSSIHADFYKKAGFPVSYAPWGTSPEWYLNLDLERDIDVLWMGKRRSRRRSMLIDKVQEELSSRGFLMYIADNETNPFIFGDLRTRFFNRAKITLGLSPSWYDTSYVFRINLAAANRSLFVSETVLPHAPEFIPNKHYVTTPVEDLIETLIYYLKHESKRNNISDIAYNLIANKLTLQNSVNIIMNKVQNYSGINHF